MRFEIDPRAPSPPSVQLADQVRFAVAAGRLVAGERLPSVRVLAVEVRVNPNTVSRAWRELARDGVVETRRGEGVYVAQGGLELCRALRDERISERLGRAVAEARGGGLDEDEVTELVRAALEAWRQVCQGDELSAQRESVSETGEE